MGGGLRYLNGARLPVSAMKKILITVALATTISCSGTPERTEIPEVQETLSAQVPVPSTPIKRAVPTAQGADPGSALVTMRIPRFGKDWQWTAVEGTRPDDLAKGPGHIIGTALPGERGNASFAAHRAGYGDPFIDFDRLKPGDKIYLSQGNTEWVYEVTTSPEIIEPTEVWVLNRFAKGRWMTLTTCWPKYGNEKRMYVRAAMVLP